MDKEAAKKEIAKLIDDFEKNREYYDKTDEANIETKLIEPLFAALGWAKNDFEKREKVKRKDRRGITDYTYKLSEKSVFIVEAKKVKVDVNWDKAAWKQAISYTFSKKVSFSVLTNFKDLLIFCTDDEMAMRPFRQMKYTEYLTSRFDELLLLSRESFEQNLIFDRAASEGRMKKRRTIDDELLDDMIASRKKIAESIEQNYKGKYSTLEKDDIAQRIFGRLIFIRKCEDKQINFDKGNKEIELVRTVTDLPHDDAYPALKKLFTKYNDAFDSGLFMKGFDSDVDKIELDGKVVKELIKHTYESSDGNYIYNFEWIDADVLGNIYEQYLGHILKETAKQTRIKESHAHRKEQGIYYTPTDIVKYIVENTLSEILKEKKPEDARKLKVLDPACGSGSFLIKAFDVLEDYYEKHPIEAQKRLDSTGDFYTTKEQVLVNNIHGVDLDRKAVEIAQLNLLLKVAEKGHRLPLLQKNIQNGNSLIDDESVAGAQAFKWEDKFADIMKDGGFDVIVGNPPYVNIFNIHEPDRSYFQKTYETAKNKSDLYAFFIENSIKKLLKDEGKLGFIISNTWTSIQSFEQLRKLILEKTLVEVIVPLEMGVFADATVVPIIIILRKTSNNKKILQNNIKIMKFDGRSYTLQKEIPQQLFLNSKGHIVSFSFDSGSKTIFDKITKDSMELGEVGKFSLGIKTADNTKFVLPTKIDNDCKKVLKGRYIKRYMFSYHNEWIWYKPAEMMKRKGAGPRKSECFTVPKKIILQEISGDKLIATLDTEQHFALDTVNVLYELNSLFRMEYILGLLNSKIINYWYGTQFKGIHVKLNELRLIPIKRTNEEIQDKITTLVNCMLSLNKKLLEFGDKTTPETARLKEEIVKTDAQIDELVYKIYGITEEEKKIIEKSLER